ncbi:uncharacterized protein F4822DRAFT_387750 [Hypoxylon trugodes]|uniref:uncharacterized protein n=1 Tax=Hypoxylon trugodes TaxID=326681 RepID=UPI0021949E03|nr:uncharacterized protein F4822DRAFT_387750 [Hypoxylon trugodes]KAI1394276.1 hypothetical protein F4822DRAFT_387750 [Hypoxylon trugodes]
MDLPPAPNGLSNRWNLGLHWGICSGPNCHIRNNLLKCGACRVILYCGTSHQKADQARHKSSCDIIKNASAELVQAEHDMRARPGDAYMPENPFETARGQFWFWKPTRPYMQKRFELTSALLNTRTGDAVEAALEHSLEMLHLNPGDNQSVRSQVPGLYLRLGRDQEAYDFIKWYNTIGSAAGYEWGNPESPFLNLHDENVFEGVNACNRIGIDLSHLAYLTSLKVRLLLDLQMLEKQSKKPSNRNADYDKKMEWIREDAISDVLYKRRDIVERSDWADLIADLNNQLKKLIKHVEERYKHYWPALKSPGRWAAAIPILYALGSPEEISLAFRQTRYCWAECPSALEFVKTQTST